MKRHNPFYPFALILLSFATGCIEPYPSPVTNKEVSYLVIDASVNSIDGSALVRLSRATELSSKKSPPAELGAIVSLEDSDGNALGLTEKGDGAYEKSNLPIDKTKKYRIYIKTLNGSEYKSDFVTTKKTPAIDSITWSPSLNRDGVDIFVTTHDDTKASRYYQWSFEETYEYAASFLASVRLEKDVVVLIPSNELTYTCWRTLPSQKVLVASTDRLTEDLIFKFPINSIPKGSQKTHLKYSILVKQKSISLDAYNYWLNLQKTTENLGSIFDPLPGRVVGNIHNITNNNEPVLGYFDIGEYQEKRIFIKNKELPNDLKYYVLDPTCELTKLLIADLNKLDVRSSSLVEPLYQGTTIIGYYYSSKYCSDCRLQNGVTTQPPYWK
jgi:hypothetical protein